MRSYCNKCYRNALIKDETYIYDITDGEEIKRIGGIQIVREQLNYSEDIFKALRI